MNEVWEHELKWGLAQNPISSDLILGQILWKILYNITYHRPIKKECPEIVIENVPDYPGNIQNIATFRTLSGLTRTPMSGILNILDIFRIDGHFLYILFYRDLSDFS